MQVRAALLGRGSPAAWPVPLSLFQRPDGHDHRRSHAELLDCRRTELFQRELIAALQIVQRGD